MQDGIVLLPCTPKDHATISRTKEPSGCVHFVEWVFGGCFPRMVHYQESETYLTGKHLECRNEVVVILIGIPRLLCRPYLCKNVDNH